MSKLHTLDNFLFFTILILGCYDYDLGKSKKDERNEKIEEDLIHFPLCPLCSSKYLVHLGTTRSLTVLFISLLLSISPTDPFLFPKKKKIKNISTFNIKINPASDKKIVNKKEKQQKEIDKIKI